MKTRNKKLSLFLSFCTPVLATSFLVSCTPSYRPSWGPENQQNRWNTNAHYDDGSSDPNVGKEGPNIKGNWENSYNIKREQILEVFAKVVMSLTEAGKKLTAQEFYQIASKVINEKVLPNGKYKNDPKFRNFDTLDKVFSSDSRITKYLTSIWPDISNFNDAFFEIRYTIYRPNPGDNFLVMDMRLFWSNKHHIDSKNFPIMRHDTGIGIGPIFTYKIKGFLKTN
ncbi:Uncharacterised protein [Metamycoplasma arthritidis]|uniref:Hypothetical lipoprotein n=1 Tax=Metamycoplasma arthritidis (strain 158L3-1) TaxID=243272 RepID=B3PN72_META1|nr:hypothetical protein [Metamycoplasma arthritidis]ACF07474.1 hypothetical lipoprotein [Metamycoplasma arthritidis 158L3-1]VEU78995.1 Uncharacterised protein [Metamycoplasma arthritidis]